MENLKSPSTISKPGRISPSDIRVHFAARLIAFYCTTGSSKQQRSYFIRPLDLDNSIFNFYFDAISEPAFNQFKIVVGCLSVWPVEKLENFLPYPVLRLLARHDVGEQKQIREILGEKYGFDFSIRRRSDSIGTPEL